MLDLNVIKIIFILLYLKSYVHGKACYWNAQNSYQLFGSKTPYDTIRGDIREFKTAKNCHAISIWNMNRHGNRGPSAEDTICMREMASLKDVIIASYESGTSQLCAQDIDNFRKWRWNNTLELDQYQLTSVGYEELYGIGKRIREKYLHLFKGPADQFYVRSTGEQRAIISRVAFVKGLTDGFSLNLTVANPTKRDDVIGPYHTCDRYKKRIRTGKVVTEKQNMYIKSAEFIAVQNAVQKRLGINTKLTADNIFCIYDLCRYYRSWSPILQTPWCAVFSNEDLIVLEYFDDLVHYYRNGYGSWVNINLGKLPLKNLYESFEAAVNGSGKRFITYFTHETMTEMLFSTMGLFGGDEPLQADVRNVHRVWRTSNLAAFASNIIAVLNSCTESGNQTYRVQVLINEKKSSLCSLKGCTWAEFQNKFGMFTSANVNFCSLDNVNDLIDALPQFL